MAKLNRQNTYVIYVVQKNQGKSWA